MIARRLVRIELAVDVVGLRGDRDRGLPIIVSAAAVAAIKCAEPKLCLWDAPSDYYIHVAKPQSRESDKVNSGKFPLCGKIVQ